VIKSVDDLRDLFRELVYLPEQSLTQTRRNTCSLWNFWISCPFI